MIRNLYGRVIVSILSVSWMVLGYSRPASADYAAIASGFWNDSNTWVSTSTGVPEFPVLRTSPTLALLDTRRTQR